MKVRITKFNGRENLQINLRKIAKGERFCNLVEKPKLDLQTRETPCKASISESIEPERQRITNGN